ncbi:MerR family transcriptional regulator (plasmid) [Deinococcus radiomollis]|uniref:MerR family transcriptional regulator n=1 Tax=Deinococcus radiomollis TaxID=468916 RepID=UPI003892C454
MSTIRIGELAEQAGVNIETIRYYERRGLIDRPARSTGGHRAFDLDAVQLIRAIKAAQSLGFTLAEIEELTELTFRQRNAVQVTERAQAKIREIDEKIALFQEMRQALSRVIEAECDSLLTCSGGDDCPVYDLVERNTHEPQRRCSTSDRSCS